MKKTSQLINLPILSISEGKECGKVRDLLIDAANAAAVALVLETTEVDWFYGAKLLPYEAIVGIGESALVINKSADILPIAERTDFGALLKANVKVIGTKVLTKSGEIKGKVIEFSVDPAGKIQACEMEKPDGTIINIPSKNVITFGKEVLFIDRLEDAGSVSSQAVAAIEPEKKTDISDKAQLLEPTATVEETAANIANKIIPTPIPEIKPNVAVPPVADIAALEKEQQPATQLPPVEPVAATDKVVPVPTPTPMPMPEVKPTEPLPSQPAIAPETEDAVKNPEDKRRELLIGKKVSKRIETENGVLIVDKNGIVTEEVLQKATLTNKLKELYINIIK